MPKSIASSGLILQQRSPKQHRGLFCIAGVHGQRARGAQQCCSSCHRHQSPAELSACLQAQNQPLLLGHFICFVPSELWGPYPSSYLSPISLTCP